MMSGMQFLCHVERELLKANGCTRLREEPGSIERYKARLVAQGFTQQRGADYDETFSPVVRMESLRVLIALWT